MKKIGLVVAMYEESKALFLALGTVKNTYPHGNFVVCEYICNGTQVFVTNSGIGEINAALATQLLIICFKVEAIINFGAVGSLDNSIACKDLVCVDEIVHYDFTLGSGNIDNYGKYPHQRDSAILSTNRGFFDNISDIIALRKVRIASGDKFVETKEIKDWLTQQFGAQICDMESAGIYFACKNFDVPVLMIKCVSDNADKSAHEDFWTVLREGISAYVGIVVDVIRGLK